MRHTALAVSGMLIFIVADGVTLRTSRWSSRRNWPPPRRGPAGPADARVRPQRMEREPMPAPSRTTAADGSSDAADQLPHRPPRPPDAQLQSGGRSW